MTNEKCIKSMTSEELATLLYQIFDCHTCPAKTYVCNCSDRYVQCKKTILNWLKKEKEE